ncbi:MAG TPA: hypothetical protein VLX28_22325 [Thermoanaerobaculia bacterium]|nr:hypothetical protein [Thermoanaerobaculia bacterium]
MTLGEGRSLLDLAGLKQDLEDLMHCPVDVVTERALSLICASASSPKPSRCEPENQKPLPRLIYSSVKP